MPTASNPYESALDQALADEKMLRNRIEAKRLEVAEAIEAMRKDIAGFETQAAEISGLVDALMARVPINSRAFYAGKLASIRPPTMKTNRGGTAYESISALVDRPPHREWSAPEIQEVLQRAGITLEIEPIRNALNYLCRRERLFRTSRGRYMPIGMYRALKHTEEIAS